MAVICVSEMIPPHTGMYGLVGFFDSPRPWLMKLRICPAVSTLASGFSAGTYLETPPWPK
jgi:hypothetical protein